MRTLQSLTALLVLSAVASTLLGCPRPNPTPLVPAIELSQPDYNFGTNPLPAYIYVANTNATFNSLTITAKPSTSWIKVDPAFVVSNAPAPNGDRDSELVTVSIDRRNLSAGTHQGTVVFSAPGVISQTLTVRVTQTSTGGGAQLSIVNPIFTYAQPYLVDMHFALKDSSGHSVVVEPATMNLEAFEGTVEVNPALNGLQIKRAAARQLKANLVFDYSLSMQLETGAINAMETAAKTVLLPALNADAQVGIWEFHRDDRSPLQVSDFTTNRGALNVAIDSIQDDFVMGFSSGSRAWDALVAAAQTFPTANPEQESRYIILFSNGRDTSSINSANNVVAVANARGVRIYTIAFGDNVNFLSLSDIAARTGGLYFPADDVDEVDDAFRQIVQDLDGQYNIRWASLKRTASDSFFPSFSLEANGASVSYTATRSFVPTNHEGDVLRGELRLVASGNDDSTEVFLRADYMPRAVREFHFTGTSEFPFTVSKLQPADDGLIGDWTLDFDRDETTGDWFIDVSTTGAAISFATFGPLLQFDFDVPAANPGELFDAFEIDNTVYGAGQFFEIQGL